MSLRRSVGLAGAAAALAVPGSASASLQQVLLPGPTPYPTQSPPLVAGGAPPPVSLPFAVRGRAVERVLAGVGPGGELHQPADVIACRMLVAETTGGDRDAEGRAVQRVVLHGLAVRSRGPRAGDLSREGRRKTDEQRGERQGGTGFHVGGD